MVCCWSLSGGWVEPVEDKRRAADLAETVALCSSSSTTTTWR